MRVPTVILPMRVSNPTVGCASGPARNRPLPWRIAGVVLVESLYVLWTASRGYFFQDGFGWMKIQATRPQTLAYGLTDSPVGQLAWIVEKFKEWTDSTDRPEDAVSRDQMLTNVSLYWLTATAGSSAQLYYESEHLDADFGRTWAGPWPLAMPVGVAVLPKDASRPIRRWAEMILPTLTRWTEFERGGHFAAMEQPQLFVNDVRAFARSLC